MGALTTNLTRQLTAHLQKECKETKVDGTDTYDADFALGTIMDWLEREGACLTPMGVKKFRKGSRWLRGRT